MLELTDQVCRWISKAKDDGKPEAARRIVRHWNESNVIQAAKMALLELEEKE